jgi:hypothetical protein
LPTKYIQPLLKVLRALGGRYPEFCDIVEKQGQEFMAEIKEQEDKARVYKITKQIFDSARSWEINAGETLSVNGAGVDVTFERNPDLVYDWLKDVVKDPSRVRVRHIPKPRSKPGDKPH